VIVNGRVQSPLIKKEAPWPQLGGFVLAVLFGPALFILSLLPALVLAYISFVAMFVVGVDDKYPSWTAVILGWSALVTLPLSLGSCVAMGRAFGISRPWTLVGLYLGYLVPACLLAAYGGAI
jgi:hypothetical protein